MQSPARAANSSPTMMKILGNARSHATQSLQSVQPQPPQPPQKSTQSMSELLGDGYFRVPKALWDYLPKGCHIRYARAGPAPIIERFREGGFVKSHFVTDAGEHMIMLESAIGGKKGDIGYHSIPIVHSEIDVIWKKYARECFVEMYIMSNMLADKKMKEDAINNELTALGARVETLENILRAVLSNR